MDHVVYLKGLLVTVVGVAMAISQVSFLHN